MNTSSEINEISAALAKAQAEIQNPAKDHVNPHFKNNYADLTAGLNAVRPALSKHGLAVIQATQMDGDLLSLETRIVHASGQWIASLYPVCKFPVAQQQMGSALTYSRRYALFALVGIAGEDDDDGNEASQDKVPAKPASRPTPVDRRADPTPFDTDPALPDSIISDLLMQGDKKAKEGMVGLGEWWKGLTGPERHAIGSEQLSAWKKTATQVKDAA